MLVRVKASGCIEDVHDFAGEAMCLDGRAERIVLNAENAGGPAATVGIEMAMLEPQQEHAVVEFVRTRRSRLARLNALIALVKGT